MSVLDSSERGDKKQVGRIVRLCVGGEGGGCVVVGSVAVSDFLQGGSGGCFGGAVSLGEGVQ